MWHFQIERRSINHEAEYTHSSRRVLDNDDDDDDDDRHTYLFTRSRKERN